MGKDMVCVEAQLAQESLYLIEMKANVGGSPFLVKMVKDLSYPSSPGVPHSPFSIPPDLFRNFLFPATLDWVTNILFLPVCISEQPALPRLYFRQQYLFILASGLYCPKGFFPLDFSISVKENTVKINDTPRTSALCSYFIHKQLLWTITRCWR